MPALKKCYYEVLGIERNATDNDIKKAFRKLALQMHPDKNPDRMEEAKTEFQFLQQAYEILSNPQERSWYDEHRTSCLNENFEDDSIDLIPYCMSSCYSGFGDDEKSFYSVYRDLFERIAAEELEARIDENDEVDIPNFGDSRCSYEKIVGPFYAFWESFCTRKQFAWLDEFDTRQAGCRRVSRLMDKENKKLRQEAKRDWNQKARALVDFAKRKDKRVQAWKAEQEIKLKEKEAALAQKFAEDKAKMFQERKKILESLKKEKNRTTSTSDSHAQLKEIETWMTNEFGEGGEEVSEDEEEAYHCKVCSKVFRTINSFSSHERSKRHLALVQSREATKEEEDEQFSDNNVISDVENLDEDLNDSGNQVNGELESAVATDGNHKILHSADPANISISKTEDSLGIDSHEDGDGEHKLLRNDKFGGRKQNLIEDDEVEKVLLLVDEVSLNSKTNNGITTVENTKVKKKRRANKANKIPVEVGPTIEGMVYLEVSKATYCEVCKENFKSRTLLFEHLKLTKHAIPLDTKSFSSKNLANDDFNEKDRNKRGKGKGRRR